MCGEGIAIPFFLFFYYRLLKFWRRAPLPIIIATIVYTGINTG